jgi:flagellar basal-body rod modification protein FlgD
MSTIFPVTPTASTSASSATDTTPNSSQTLSQNDFLKLLVAQMQYQDPSNPQSDTQMASQMAQFSTLTASTQMSSSLSMLQANNLVGTNVTVQVTPGSSSALASGVVTGVTLVSGSPQVIVTDVTTGKSTPYNLSQVVSVSPTVAAAAAATPTTTTPPSP